MNLKKTVAIAAAAGALTAVALPAMAFENEFHGTSRLRYFISNYENGGGGNPLAQVDAAKPLSGVGAVTGNRTDALRVNNYFEQRTRIFYTAKASDDLMLKTGFEIDSVFGDKAQSATTGAATPAGTGRNMGGALESDTVNLETKWVYLQFKIPSTPVTVLAGIQPFKDSLKGIFADFDAAGIVTSTKLGGATLNAGYFRGYDQSYFATAPRGMDNWQVGAIEGKFALSKDANLAAVYYILDDNRAIDGVARAVYGTDFQAHVLGLAGDFKMGPLTLSGFGAYQGGIIKDYNLVTRGNAYLNAFAYNVAAKAAVGPGSLKTAFLFTSGNDNGDIRDGHLKGWVGTSQFQNNAWASTAGTSTYNESGLFLLNRNAAAGTGTTDAAIVYNPGNGTNPTTMQGLYLLTMGYDAKLGSKAYFNTNLGFAWSARTNAIKPINLATGRQNNTNFMGTEVNMETGYKMYDNLTFSLQAAYVFLGNYYKGTSCYGSATAARFPQDPYTLRTSLIFNY